LLELIKKDMKLMFRERTFVSIVFLLVFVASISSVITFGLIMLYNPDYLGYAGSARIVAVNDCNIGVCYDEKTAMELFRDEKVDAVLVFKEIDGRKYVDVIVPDDEIRAAQVLSFVKKQLVSYEEELREKYGIPNLELKVYSGGREVTIPSGSSTIFKFIYLILIPLLAITTSVVAAGMTIDSICEEIQTKSLEVLLSTPISPFRISIAKIASPIVFSSSIIALWLLLLAINRIDIVNPVMVFLLSVSLTALFVSVAYVMAAKLKDRERAQLIFSVIAAGLLPLLVTKAVSPAVMIGRAAAGAEINLVAALTFTILSFTLLVVSPLAVKISQ